MTPNTYAVSSLSLYSTTRLAFLVNSYSSTDKYDRSSVSLRLLLLKLLVPLLTANILLEHRSSNLHGLGQATVGDTS